MSLVGGKSAYEGRVEVCLSQRWGTVTDDGWSTADAQVVCRQMGYDIQGNLKKCYIYIYYCNLFFKFLF